MLSSSSASMFDLYFYGTKTFSGDFELYIADVILHLKTCGLRVRLRGRILFPSSTKIWNSHQNKCKDASTLDQMLGLAPIILHESPSSKVTKFPAQRGEIKF